jgi:hypothetical protein
MDSTTIKLSVQTRDRLRAFGGATYEDTVVEALDALDATRFWSQADAALAWHRTLSPTEQLARQRVVDAIDDAFDGME